MPWVCSTPGARFVYRFLPTVGPFRVRSSQDFRSCDLPWERMNMDIRITGNTLRDLWIALALVVELSEVEGSHLRSQPASSGLKA